MARFAPPPAEMLALYGALRERPADLDDFIGLITTAVSPLEFLAPENLTRILTAAT